MKIFLDTASLEIVKQWLPTGIIDGITTNPTHLSKEGGNPTHLVCSLATVLKGLDVSVEVTATEPADVYKQARAIAALADNIVVKIPCHRQYYPIIKQLVCEGISINITLLFSLEQALFMCKLGVKYISPFIGRLEDANGDAIQLLHEIRHMIDHYQFTTQILAASVRNVIHFNAVIEAGADVATVPAAVLEKATEHELTNKGIALFNADWRKLGVKQFP